VIASVVVLLGGCGEETLPVVPDSVSTTPEEGAAAPGSAPAVDPINSAISSGDPTLPPGRKE
jgi:hypothetical protein